jgi:hypothetical protein
MMWDFDIHDSVLSHDFRAIRAEINVLAPIFGPNGILVPLTASLSTPFPSFFLRVMSSMMKSSVSSDFKETRTNSCTQPSELRPFHTETAINERSLIRKIDWRLLPVLCTIYIIQFMDKVVLNYANVMGIQLQLHMTINEFVWSGTAFFLGYLIAEIPQGM